jgi:hypothetical protein
MRLTDLRPKWRPTPVADVDAAITFLCPACRKGIVSVWLVLGGEPRKGAHVANVLPPAWDAMTIRPSIADEGRCTAAKRTGCPGWHGFITNGEAS